MTRVILKLYYKMIKSLINVFEMKYEFNNPYSAGIEFSRQNLMSADVRF